MLTTLVILSAVALIAVSYLALNRHEAVVTDAQADRLRAELAALAAFEEAKDLLARHAASDDYLVTAVTRQLPGERQLVRHAFLSRPGEEELVHVPLFAGGLEQVHPMPRLDHAATAILASEPLAVPSAAFDPALAESRDILTPGLSHLVDGRLIPETRRPPTRFLQPDAAPGEKPIRYTYWIEDLQGYPNLDAIGSWTDHHGHAGTLAAAGVRYGYGPLDSRADGGSGGDAGLLIPLPGSPPGTGWQFPRAFRGQSAAGQIAPGLSPREIHLHPWAIAELPASRHPFAAAPRLGAGRHWLAASGAWASLAPEAEARFSLGLLPYEERPLIPWGHDYPDAGLPRYPINTLLREERLSSSLPPLGIVEIIQRNLPRFSERAGAFPDSYLGTLAANLIDYADEDSLPSLPATVARNGGLAFRGVDSFPAVNEFYLRFTYDGYLRREGEFVVRFLATPFVEFWNPSDRRARMEGLRLKFRFIEDFGFAAPDGSHLRLDGEDPPSLHRDAAFSEPVTVDLEPNEFRVVRFGDLDWRFNVPAPEGMSAFVLERVANRAVSRAGAVSHGNSRGHFQLYWGDHLIHRESRRLPGDRTDPPEHGMEFIAMMDGRDNDDTQGDPRDGIVRPGDHVMRGTPLGMHARKGNFYGTHYGDPWMSYHAGGTQQKLYYSRDGTPGGRNFRHENVGQGGGRDQWMKNLQRIHDWPDGGYSTRVPPAPRSAAAMPDELPPAPHQPELAPFRISNLGRYFSVSELGHLHDPHMWRPVSDDIARSPSRQLLDELRDGHVRDLPLSSVPDPTWGGGNTLRIGRREHSLFDQPGMRASQLLDLFHAGTNGTNLTLGTGGPDSYLDHDPRDHQPPPTARVAAETGQRPWSDLYPPQLHAESEFRLVHGQLNLNSVPTALEIEALLRGAFASSAAMPDLAAGTAPDGPAFVGETDPGRAAAKGLDPGAASRVADRLLASRPYYSPSHLARVTGRLLHEEDALPEHFSDAEAEETFARLFNLSTLSSRHFRVHCYGETLAPGDHDPPIVLSRSRRVHDIHLRPVRAANGAIERVAVELLSSREP